MAKKDTANYVHWTSRWTFIMAATGSAVGLGNVWKFPYITGEYGGGAFILVYLLCILLIGVPIMIAEALIGRVGRTDPIDALLALSKKAQTSPLWSIIAISGTIAGLMILMFYSVVAGWSLDYVVQSSMGKLAALSPQAVGESFAQLTSNANRQIFYHTVFVLLTGGVVAVGVTAGIGTAVRVLMPLLLLLLLVLVGYSLAKGHFIQAVHFMFDFDFQKLCPRPEERSIFTLIQCKPVLVAMGHAFFTLSLGMSAIMAYGAYMPEEARVANTVLTVAILDTAIALLAGLAIFPLVFANGVEPSSGPGLMFVSLPIAFSQMPGGQFIGTLFFVLLAVAALSSSISLVEPAVAWMEKKGIKRIFGTSLFIVLGWFGGIAVIYHAEFFDFLDTATSQFMLPLGGLLIALFAGWFMQQSIIKAEVGIHSPLIYQAWLWVLRIISPLGIIIVFVDSFGWI